MLFFHPDHASVEVTTWRAVLDWTLTVAFAALLVAAICKLDDTPSRDPSPRAAASQAQPEGWALWSGELSARTSPPAAQPVPAKAEPAAR